MAALDPVPLLLTAKLAVITTAILFFLGLPLALWLSSAKFRFRFALEALVAMPLVLPPSVLGFYLLMAFSPGGLGLKLAFTFWGLVAGSVIYSLPFMVQPLQAGFSAVPPSLAEASYTLGRTKLETFFRVILPNMKPSILTGLVLTFAHTVGEFGVVLMIGGNIPGETKVASIAIYDEVEALRYGNANSYALILFALTFSILLAVYWFNKRLVKVT